MNTDYIISPSILCVAQRNRKKKDTAATKSGIPLHRCLLAESVNGNSLWLQPQDNDVKTSDIQPATIKNSIIDVPQQKLNNNGSSD
ncbi:MAG: hypothetical protein V1899_00305 [Planctomycetota bacterium]